MPFGLCRALARAGAVPGLRLHNVAMEQTLVFAPPVRRRTVRAVVAVVLLAVGIVPFVFLGVTLWRMSPTRYEVAHGLVTIHSGDPLVGGKVVRLSDITDARMVPLTGGKRVAGTALPGLCAGRFSYADLGLVWQATACKGQGLVLRARTESLPIVLSPPDAGTFLRALKTGEPLSVTLPAPRVRSLRSIMLVVGLVTMLGLGPLALLLTLGPGRMLYRIGDGHLEVRTIFSTNRWRLAGLSARSYEPTGVRRVIGTAAPGYYTGLFREAGESTRVYATQLEDVVLFEGAARLLLSPADREGFLRALAHHGAQVK